MSADENKQLNKKLIIAGVGIFILIVVGGIIVSSGSQQTAAPQTTNVSPASASVSAQTTTQSNSEPTTSSADMTNSCQSIADAQIRNGFFEKDYTPQTDTQPQQASDSIYYDVAQSTCYFTEHLIRYPAVNSTSDPYMVESNYLYAAALAPNGSLQYPAAGDSDTNAPSQMGWCLTSTYQYPTAGSKEIHCVDFKVNQSGAGTADFHSSETNPGIIVSQSQYDALVREYMGTNI